MLRSVSVPSSRADPTGTTFATLLSVTVTTPPTVVML